MNRLHPVFEQALAPFIPDDPNRVAPPDYGPVPRAFEQYDIREQLDAADIACRRKFYAEAAAEALPESAEYDAWLRKLLDSSASDAEIVREARRVVLAHLQRVAELRDENLADFV